MKDNGYTGLAPGRGPDGTGSGQPGLGARLGIGLVRLYQYGISPLFPPTCRFTPTCSQYAVEAIGRFGLVRGGIRAIWRILRCHPFSRGGYDPVK